MLVTQKLDLKKHQAALRAHLKEEAFREWQYRLTRGDRLPRGKYFRNKAAGRPLIIIDEAWRFLG